MSQNKFWANRWPKRVLDSFGQIGVPKISFGQIGGQTGLDSFGQIGASIYVFGSFGQIGALKYALDK